MLRVFPAVEQVAGFRNYMPNLAPALMSGWKFCRRDVPLQIHAVVQEA
jgi:hypothetical protein